MNANERPRVMKSRDGILHLENVKKPMHHKSPYTMTNCDQKGCTPATPEESATFWASHKTDLAVPENNKE